MHHPIGLSVANSASTSATGRWSGRCRVIWMANQVGDRRLGDKLTGRHLLDDWATWVVSSGQQMFERLTMIPSKMLSYEQPLHFHLYSASMYEGSLGSCNSVCVSVCSSVCHMHGLWQI